MTFLQPFKSVTKLLNKGSGCHSFPSFYFFPIIYMDGARTENLDGQVVMQCNATGLRNLLICQNVGGVRPPPNTSVFPDLDSTEIKKCNHNYWLISFCFVFLLLMLTICISIYYSTESHCSSVSGQLWWRYLVFCPCGILGHCCWQCHSWLG